MTTDLAGASPLAAAQALTAGLVPPGVFIGGDEGLRLTSFNSASAVRLAVEGLQFIAGRGPQWFSDGHAPNTDRTARSTVIPLAEGWLSQVHVRAASGSPRRGACYIIVELVRGTANGNVTPLGVLVQGYVTDTSRRGWPGSPLELSTEGPGLLRSITGTDPAANTEIAEAVPTNARWLLHAIRFSLVTDATVANREVSLTLDDGANVYARIPSRVSQAASLTFGYTAMRDAALEAVAQDTERLIRLPWGYLQGGHRFNTATTNRQATDNYSAPQYLVEEWIED